MKININKYKQYYNKNNSSTTYSDLPYYCTPPVCVPDVIGALAVWRLSKKKKMRHNIIIVIIIILIIIIIPIPKFPPTYKYITSKQR